MVNFAVVCGVAGLIFWSEVTFLLWWPLHHCPNARHSSVVFVTLFTTPLVFSLQSCFVFLKPVDSRLSLHWSSERVTHLLVKLSFALDDK